MRWPSARHCIVFLLVSDNRSYKTQSHLLPNDNQQLLHKQGFFCGAMGWPLSAHSLGEMPFVAGQARSTFHWFSKAQHTLAQSAPKTKFGSNPGTASASDACLGKCQKLARGNDNSLNVLLFQQAHSENLSNQPHQRKENKKGTKISGETKISTDNPLTWNLRHSNFLHYCSYLPFISPGEAPWQKTSWLNFPGKAWPSFPPLFIRSTRTKAQLRHKRGGWFCLRDLVK